MLRIPAQSIPVTQNRANRDMSKRVAISRFRLSAFTLCRPFTLHRRVRLAAMCTLKKRLKCPGGRVALCARLSGFSGGPASAFSKAEMQYSTHKALAVEREESVCLCRFLPPAMYASERARARDVAANAFCPGAYGGGHGWFRPTTRRQHKHHAAKKSGAPLRSATSKD
jgi:hypothetical protein